MLPILLMILISPENMIVILFVSLSPYPSFKIVFPHENKSELSAIYHTRTKHVKTKQQVRSSAVSAKTR